MLAAAVRVQLPHLDDWNARRRQVAAWYRDGLAGLPLQLPAEVAGREHVYHLYVVQTDARDDVRTDLHARGVAAAVHYPVPVHLQRAYEHLGLAGTLPATESVAPRVLSLPMFPEMTREQVAAVAAALEGATAATVVRA
jgi:dTDP-4-amino-4,6-dideoxygalactose transaminase